MTHRSNSNEMRGAARFPIKLAIAVDNGEAAVEGETHNLSAAGVLFDVNAEIAVGSDIQFTISIPAAVIGAPSDVRVTGAGRVVRSAPEAGKQEVAAVIDEYRFERA